MSSSSSEETDETSVVIVPASNSRATISLRTGPRSAKQPSLPTTQTVKNPAGGTTTHVGPRAGGGKRPSAPAVPFDSSSSSGDESDENSPLPPPASSSPTPAPKRRRARETAGAGKTPQEASGVPGKDFPEAPIVNPFFDPNVNRVWSFVTGVAGSLMMETTDLFQPDFDVRQYEKKESRELMAQTDIYTFIFANCRAQLVSAIQKSWDYIINLWTPKYHWRRKFASVSELIADPGGSVAFAGLVFATIIHFSFFSGSRIHSTLTAKEKSKLRTDAFDRVAMLYETDRW